MYDLNANPDISDMTSNYAFRELIEEYVGKNVCISVVLNNGMIIYYEDVVVTANRDNITIKDKDHITKIRMLDVSAIKIWNKTSIKSKTEVKDKEETKQTIVPSYASE